MELVRLCIFFILWVSVQAGSETELELKLLGLQNFKKSDDSNYGADLSEFAAIQRRKEIFIDLFGGNYRRRPRLVKVRRKARIPRRSYGGGYTAPRRSSYKVPTTNKPSYSPPQLYQSPHKAYPPPSTPQPYYAPPTTPLYEPPSYTPPTTPQYSKQPQITPVAPQYPSYTPRPASYSGESSSPASYSYHYEVEDGEYQAWEKRSGSSTQGSYSVLLPDGRTMIVTYSVPDDSTGYMAQVDYKGEAKYPDSTPPSYPAPAFSSYPTSPAPHYGR